MAELQAQHARDIKGHQLTGNLLRYFSRQEAKVTKKTASLTEFDGVWRYLETVRAQEIFTELTCLDMCSYSPFFAGLATSPAKSPPAATREEGMKSEAALSFGICFADVCLCIEMASERVFAGPSSNG